ncbi:uncharacterized protein LOC119734697 isoform X2 [Patiria miniata]|uniref:Uncharacterized protein n=1 Tax=Patiria miniata TaxID=46514 RepID=A0A914AKQ3_PATMI|nr:uncharacterized protein LOC119734697 isoform X2 [Patiria miniata]
MATSNKLCYTSEQILPVAPLLTAKQLLELPGRRSLTMSKKLMALWKSKAVPNVSAKSIVSYQTVRRDKETSSATESLSSQVQGSNQEIMPGSPERPRDVSVDSATGSRMEETPPIFSDLSQLSESRDSTQPSFQIEHTTGRQKRHLTGQSIEEETTTPLDKTGMEIPVPTLQLEGIPETHKSPENSSSEEDQPIKIHHQKVVRDIAELTAVDETITFKDLVPLSTSCARASKVFSICVEFAASNLIVIWQTIAYGDIYIKRGELF